MTAERPTIVATSIGFQGTGRGAREWTLGPVYRLMADLARADAHPRVCIIDTAEGDDPVSLASMYAAFGRRGFIVSHLALFPQPSTTDIPGLLAGQDIIWVAGGSVANLLVLWKLHGLRESLRRAWQDGVVLAGVSAGSVCWFAGGTTDSFGPELRPVRNGLGFLPFSNSPHHDAEPLRRPTITSLLRDGSLPECYATDNGAALVFQDTDLVEAVTEKEGARAWHLRRRHDGTVEETVLPTRLLAPW